MNKILFGRQALEALNHSEDEQRAATQHEIRHLTSYYMTRLKQAESEDSKIEIIAEMILINHGSLIRGMQESSIESSPTHRRIRNIWSISIINTVVFAVLVSAVFFD